MINNINIKRNYQKAFTLVELTVAIAVVAILAGVVIVGYGAWRQNIAKNEAQSDLRQLTSLFESTKNFGSGYPSSIPNTYKGSPNLDVTYVSGDAGSYCIEARSKSNPSIVYYVTAADKTPRSGTCPAGGGGSNGGGSSSGGSLSGSAIQTVTSANCPASRTMIVDARDNKTYWIQKLADGKCWMLTNLAYSGGGTNTYNDTKTLLNGTNDTSVTYNQAKYYIPTGSNSTSNPSAPSVNTNGTGQYGYLYNWCAAMGGQSTTACADKTSTTPVSNPAITICPSGWRLPTGTSSGEYSTLNNSINGGSTTTDAGLTSTWLGQRSGIWSYSFSDQSNIGYYWTSSQVNSAEGYYANNGSVYFVDVTYGSDIVFSSSGVNVSDKREKYMGLAVRCIAN